MSDVGMASGPAAHITSRTSALDRVRDRKKITEERIPVCMDSGLIARKQRIEQKLTRLQARAARGKSPELEQEISDVEFQLDEATEAALEESEWFAVRALAPADYQALMDQHPPTKDQIKDARRQLGPRATLKFNTDTFADALLVECGYILTKTGDDTDGNPIFDKGEALTEEFVKEMRTGGAWNSGEVDSLANAAFEINRSDSNVGAAGND